MKREPDLTFRPSREDLDEWNRWLNAWPQGDDASGCKDLDSVMKILACIVDEYDTKGIDRSQCRVYHLALDWLATMRQQLMAFKAIAYQSCLSNSDGEPVEGTGVEKYMMYNTQTISDEDAAQLLQQGRQDTDPRVVDLWPSQALALFPSLKEDETRPET